MPRLEKLHIKNCGIIGLQELSLFAAFPLRYLRVDCTEIDVPLVVFIEHIPSLKEFFIRTDEVCDLRPPLIASELKLESFGIDNIHFTTDAFHATIKCMPALERLSLLNAALIPLNIPCPKLHSLDLSRSAFPLSKERLKILAKGMPHLHTIGISRGRSQEDVELFVKAFPNLQKIFYEPEESTIQYSPQGVCVEARGFESFLPEAEKEPIGLKLYMETYF
jgi:hypothetical protein